ncbi:MAG TPA: hypothetical protein DCE41_26750 [Cytophagales bacterium]|nr:hypothetical protein [Cytophagales bacterium]
MGAFDFLGSAITYAAFDDARAVPFQFVPALNFAAEDFLTKFIDTEQDRPHLYPYIFTHANQINQYPELYIDCYLEAYEDFGSYIDDQLKSTYYQDLYLGDGDFYQFLRQSVVYWQNKGYSEYYDQDQFINSLTDFESKTTEEIIELFNGKISCLYQGMNVDDRLIALRKLVLDGNMSGSVLGIFNKANAEETAVKIISSTPANDARALISGLVEQSLFVQLAEGFQDGGMFWHDDNLTAFSQALFGLARLAYPPPGSDSEYNQLFVQAEEEDKIFRFGQEIPFQYTVYSNSVGLGSTSTKNCPVTWDVQLTGAQVTTSLSYPTYANSNGICKYDESISFGPYDAFDQIIVFVEQGSKASEAFGLTTGSVMIMPALSFYLLNELDLDNDIRQRNQILFDLGIVVVSVASIAVGNASGLVTALSVLDALAAVSDLYLTANEDKILQTMGREDGAEFIQNWRTVTMLVGLANMGAGLANTRFLQNSVEASKKVITLWEASKSQLRGALGQQVFDSYDQVIKAISNLTTDAIDQGAVFIKNNLNQARTVITGATLNMNTGIAYGVYAFWWILDKGANATKNGFIRHISTEFPAAQWDVEDAYALGEQLKSVYTARGLRDFTDLGATPEVLAHFAKEGLVQTQVRTLLSNLLVEATEGNTQVLARLSDFNGDQLKQLASLMDSDARFVSLLEADGAILDSYKTLVSLTPNSYVSTDVDRLRVFHSLSSENQVLLRQFTDEKATSTLSKFLDDCDDELLAFLNQPDNQDFVKVLISHKGVDIPASRAGFIQDEIDDLTGKLGDKLRKWSYRSSRIHGNSSKFARAAGFEELCTARIGGNDVSQYPLSVIGAISEQDHLPQLHVRANGSTNRVILDDAIVNRNVFVDPITLQSYRRVTYHDSKLTRNSPWSTNQNSDIIQPFRDDPSLEYIQLEVRSGGDYFQNFSTELQQGNIIRIYREDVYKSISTPDGNGVSIVETINMNNLGFN